MNKKSINIEKNYMNMNKRRLRIKRRWKNTNMIQMNF